MVDTKQQQNNERNSTMAAKGFLMVEKQQLLML